VALKNKPGIYSARWAKMLGGFNTAMKKIILLLKDKKKRDANFVCSLTLCYPSGKSISSTKKLKGTISKKIKGSKGFGYDAIFIPEKKKKTFGQMTRKSKMKSDHRYLAYKELKRKVTVF